MEFDHGTFDTSVDCKERLIAPMSQSDGNLEAVASSSQRSGEDGCSSAMDSTDDVQVDGSDFNKLTTESYPFTSAASTAKKPACFINRKRNKQFEWTEESHSKTYVVGGNGVGTFGK